MSTTKEQTMIIVQKSMKPVLDKFKIHKREPYYSVIWRMIDVMRITIAKNKSEGKKI